MFCINCGTQLPDDASFCLKCGKPQKASVQTDLPKIETCEIVRVVTKPSSWTYEETFIFAAEVIGPNGKYNAFQTIPLKHNIQYPVYQQEFTPRVDELVNNLLQDGWEAVETRGDNWWNYGFRRRVTADSQKKTVVIEDKGTIGYCAKEKQERTMKDAKEVTLKNCKKVLQGVCSSCGYKIMKFV